MSSSLGMLAEDIQVSLSFTDRDSWAPTTGNTIEPTAELQQRLQFAREEPFTLYQFLLLLRIFLLLNGQATHPHQDTSFILIFMGPSPEPMRDDGFFSAVENLTTELSRYGRRVSFPWITDSWMSRASDCHLLNGIAEYFWSQLDPQLSSSQGVRYMRRAFLYLARFFASFSIPWLSGCSSLSRYPLYCLTLSGSLTGAPEKFWLLLCDHWRDEDLASEPFKAGRESSFWSADGKDLPAALCFVC
jgi:hypothetical protein